jgi:hypothetical protein
MFYLGAPEFIVWALSAVAGLCTAGAAYFAFRSLRLLLLSPGLVSFWGRLWRLFGIVGVLLMLVPSTLGRFVLQHSPFPAREKV